MPETLNRLLDDLPVAGQLDRWLAGGSLRLPAAGLPGSALPVFLTWLAQRTGRPVVAITPDPEGSFGETQAWFGDAARVVVFPAIETLPFDRLAPDEETVRRRIESIDALGRGGPLVCFTSWVAMTRPTLAQEDLRRCAFTLTTGATYSLRDLAARLTEMGYRREPTVEGRGEFSIRGGILDCFPPNRRRPVRAEFFGDELESLREFELETQGSVGSVGDVRILPGVEIVLTPAAVEQAAGKLAALDFRDTLAQVRDDWITDIERLRAGAYFDGAEGFGSYLNPEQPTLLDHLPKNALIVAVDSERLSALAKEREAELHDLVRVEVERGELPRNLDLGLVALDVLQREASGWPLLDVLRSPGQDAVDLGFSAIDAYAGRIDAFADHIQSLSRAQGRVLIVTQQERRLRELLEDRDVYGAGGLFQPARTELASGLVVLGNQPVAQGFAVPGVGLEVYGDTDLFGGLRQRVRRGIVRRSTRTWQLDFEPGDLIVHVDHGIGRFVGMRLMGDAGEEREYMQLEYADGDRLYIPVEHLDRVQRYVGGGDAAPRLQKLGSGEWDRTKRKVRESVQEIARDLLDLYSKRQLVEGHAFGEDSPWQQELEVSFPYEETPDQLKAMEEIKVDMEDARPMDRLLAGDVGFGKTELAVRAAFKAVQDGKQAAILVPTTVLAQQHLLTFQERLRPFPVSVDMLSRFRSDAEARDVLRRLRTGELDIVIGTHALLQKDCLLYTSPSPRDLSTSRMPSSA